MVEKQGYTPQLRVYSLFFMHSAVPEKFSNNFEIFKSFFLLFATNMMKAPKKADKPPNCPWLPRKRHRGHPFGE
jgi:hypothetical protein